ncbi:hypothetical protein QE152_g1256 [Popillia japonica]|uniref:Uncharacterized protein n=1 Tax=Popillia japonica TaxID=7064 RepID=A0AAW1N7J0_POPJA
MVLGTAGSDNHKRDECSVQEASSKEKLNMKPEYAKFIESVLPTPREASELLIDHEVKVWSLCGVGNLPVESVLPTPREASELLIDHEVKVWSLCGVGNLPV